MTGLYVSISPDGKIKKHLSTESGEVPLKDTTISDELIALTQTSYLKIARFSAELLDCKHSSYRDFWNTIDRFLTDQESSAPVYALLTRTSIADHVTNYRNPRNKSLAMSAIRACLVCPVPAQVLTVNLFDAICAGNSITQEPVYRLLHHMKIPAVFSLDTEPQLLFRAFDRYYIFLLQQFVAAQYRVAKCQYCGSYFIPKTKRKTLYCDREIRDGKTCKQIAPYENHKRLAAANKVIAEFDRVKGLLFRRVERADCGKKTSPIDLNYEEYYRWLEAATDARDRFLAGEITEEEALRIIHVPTIRELRENNLADYTLDYSCPQS